MSMLDRALYLASKGFYVFPLVEGAKTPLIDAWERKATRDTEQIRRWWTCPVMDIEQNYNIGIHTGRFGEQERPLCVIDVDMKNGKNGYNALLAHELEGNMAPPTLENVTPTGGGHIIYLSPTPVKNGTSVLGDGLDIRGHNGYIVGPWSQVPAGEYKLKNGFDSPTMAPEWVVNMCGAPSESEASAPKAHVSLPGIDDERARLRAMEYLMFECPPTSAGSRNNDGYRVAAKLKDFGCTPEIALELMHNCWECYPALEMDELLHVINSAYSYGRRARGSSAPEAVFSAVPSDSDDEDDEPVDPDIAENSPTTGEAGGDGISLPGSPADGNAVDRLNSQFAFVRSGSKFVIMEERRDDTGATTIDFIQEDTLHKQYASVKVQVEDRLVAATKLWMESRHRRTYNGITFAPEQKTPGMYNVWRGFACQPKKSADGDRFVNDYYLPHVRDIICDGDMDLFMWTIGAMAHAVQHPNEKLEVAIVLQGGKGVGKNKFVETMEGIFGEHYFLAGHERYITSNFNSHFEGKSIVVLDEASWAGDKKHSGVLKDFITGKFFNIERKGLETYKSPNKARLFILSNDDWVVPASEDERRYAVYKVNAKRQRDYAFFSEWTRLYEDKGGKEALLAFLQEFDISDFNRHNAPVTAGLQEQKKASLKTVQSWWLDCLTEGRIAGGDFEGWPPLIEADRLRGAYRRYLRDRNIRERALDDRTFGRELAKCAPSCKRTRRRTEGGARVYYYESHDLVTLRHDWDKFIGRPETWDPIDDDGA